MKHINLICNHQSLIKFNTNIIKQKQYILLLSRLMCKKMIEQKRFAGRHLLTFESQKLNYFGKKVGLSFWHYNDVNVIRIWAMSGLFSRFLVIFYPLSPRTPFKKCFSAHFHFCEQLR